MALAQRFNWIARRVVGKNSVFEDDHAERHRGNWPKPYPLLTPAVNSQDRADLRSLQVWCYAPDPGGPALRRDPGMSD